MAKPTDRALYGAAAQAGWTGQLPTPYPRPLGPRAMAYLQEVVDGGLATDLVGRFEQAFAEALGVKHCVATPGCTPALAVLFAAAGFAPGDELVVSSVSDYGTIQGLVCEGYLPVFADTAPGTVNVSAETIAPCLSDRTRAILVVHKTGLMVDLDPVLELARRHGLPIYEDACQAVFSAYRGRLAGTIGDAGAFSFDSEKTMGSDVGGCLVTNNDELAERWRFCGQSRGAVAEPGFGRRHVLPGYAHRMTQCTAALCLAQLEVIHEHVAIRDAMARRLNALLAQIPGIRPLPIPGSTTVWSCWMMGFSLEPGAFRCGADAFAEALVAAGLPGAGTGRYYLLPAACTFLGERAEAGEYPFSQPPASRTYRYGAESCPTAAAFLDGFIRWSTFCEKYTPADCDLAAQMVADVAARYRA